MSRSHVPLEERETVSLPDAFHIVTLAVRWMRPFARRFALKASLVVTSIAVLLMPRLSARICSTRPDSGSRS